MLFAAALAYAGLIVVFTAAWLRQLRTRNAGMVDPVWAASLAGVAVLAAALGTGATVNRVFVAVAGGLWGLRLACHLWQRNHGKPEDPRYRQFREQWGDATNRNMFWFFQLQAAISMALSVAFFIPAFQAEAPSRVALVAAVVIWLIAVGGEASADRQLRHFVADAANRGKVCQSGWWRYSRHPNYFFECVHWCAYTALSLAMPWGWLTLVPPVLMAVLLLKVSGVPMLEARLMKTRSGYGEYMRTTSALVPWPPKSTCSNTTPPPSPPPPAPPTSGRQS